MPYSTPKGARMLKIMFGMLLVMSAVLFYFVFLTFSGSIRPESNIDVLKDPTLTVPAQIRIGEQFSYNLKGEKLVDASGVTRRQIECTGNNVNLIEVIDTIEPRANKGKFEFNRLMTIPTYKQNLRANPTCRLIFNAQYNFYYSTATQENSRVIPITETFYSNEFELLEADPNAAPSDPAEAAGTSQNEVDTNVNVEQRAAPESNTRDPAQGSVSQNSTAANNSGGSSSSGGSNGGDSDSGDDPNALDSLFNAVNNGIDNAIGWIVR